MEFKAITIDGGEQPFLEIVSGIGVSPPEEQLRSSNGPGVTYWTECLWDTGAHRSGVSQKVVDILGLKPEGEVRVVFGSGETIVKSYLVDLVIPELIVIKDFMVICFPAHQTFGVIIGMDVISMGDFAITNFQGNATFSFRVPSAERIDFSEG